MILLTSGCSFSECISKHIDTWPRHLAKTLSVEHYSCAIGSQGNGLISRRLLYKCEELLQTYSASELLVGVMWSGPSRSDFYLSERVTIDSTDGTMENPTSFQPRDNGGWIIMNHHWQDKFSAQYYNTFYDPIYSQWQTLEYILHTQWYLERKNVKYFMATFTNEVLPPLEHPPQLGWLYNQIDFSKFVSSIGCMEWCRNCGTKQTEKLPYFHPSTEQHGEYVEKVIFPYLQQNKLI